MPPRISRPTKLAAGFVLGTLLGGRLDGSSISMAHEESLIWPSEIAQVLNDTNSPELPARQSALASLRRLPHTTLQRVLPDLLSSPHRDTRLAAAAIAWKVPSKDTAKQLTQWLGDADSGIRLAAATHFEAFPQGIALPGLVRALRDSEQPIQIAAATALGTLGAKQAVPGLVAALRSARGDVRQAAATSLGSMADRTAITSLLELTTDPIPAVRVAALNALGQMRDASVMERVVGALQDRNTEVQLAAAAALGTLGDPAAVAVLERQLNRTVSDAMAQGILDALAQLGTTSAIDAIVRQLAGVSAPQASAILQRMGLAATDQLKECLLSEHAAATRSGCLRALPNRENADLARVVRQTLQLGRSTPSDGLSALARVGATRDLATVLRWVSSPNLPARRSSLAAARSLLLRGGGWGPAVDPLQDALSSKSGLNEQLVLIELLGLTRSPRAQTTLLQYTASTNWRVQQAALEALASLEAFLDSNVVIGLLESPYPSVAWQAASTLRRVGGRGALHSLMMRAGGWNSQHNRLTQLALSGPFARFAKASERLQLSRQVKTAEGAARATLLEALGLSLQPDAHSLLATIARDSQTLVRAKVAELLGFHGAPAAPTLRLLLDDREAAVRANAVWALGLVGSASDWGAVARLLSDDNWAVAANASAAAGQLLARRAEPNLALEEERRNRLCSLVDSPIPHAAVNALVGLRRLAARCAESPASWLLVHGRASSVRRAAANYLASLPSDASSTTRRRLLRLCERRDLDGDVAQTCSAHLDGLATRSTQGAAMPGVQQPVKASTESDVAQQTPRVLLFFDERDQIVARHPFAVRLDNGWIRNGWTDERGAVLLDQRAGAAPQHRQAQVLPPVFLDGG